MRVARGILQIIKGRREKERERGEEGQHQVSVRLPGMKISSGRYEIVLFIAKLGPSSREVALMAKSEKGGALVAFFPPLH